MLSTERTGNLCTWQVSEVRHGQVISFDSATAHLTLQPWPDASVHPLRKSADAAMQRAAADDDQEDEPALAADSPYDEAGVLTTDMGSFVELRLVHAAAGCSQAAEGSAGATVAGAEAAATNADVPGQPLADTDPVKDATHKATGVLMLRVLCMHEPHMPSSPPFKAHTSSTDGKPHIFASCKPSSMRCVLRACLQASDQHCRHQTWALQSLPLLHSVHHSLDDPAW